MSQVALIHEASVASSRSSLLRNWNGALVKSAERVAHYLHLLAVPCEKCKGPVIAGRICKQEDVISKETEVLGMGPICLLCGSRPEALIDPAVARHFRSVEWEWPAEKKVQLIEAAGDSLQAELSQDADRP